MIAQCTGDLLPVRARGRVHSVFARACNIETQSGELLTLLMDELSDAPHGIRLGQQVARFDSWLVAEQNAILENDALCLPDAGVTIELGGAAVWRGNVGAVARPPYGAASAAAMDALRDTVFACAPQHGIARALAHPSNAASSFDRAFAARLCQALPALACETGLHDAFTLVRAAACLVGLGPGLTPSGDDFLAGYLAALWSRAARDPDVQALLQTLAHAFPPAFARTNAISRQMLNDAVRGRFTRRMADVTHAVSRGDDVAKAAAQALASGLSSGADGLCGLLFGYAPGLLPIPAPLRSEAVLALQCQSHRAGAPA
jgi:hypothetical protein